MKIYDISIPLCNQTPVWEGDKEVRIGRTASISAGEEYNVSMFEMGAHAGTHVDAPFHVLAEGGTADQLPLEKLVGKAQVIQLPEAVECINSEVLTLHPLQKSIRRVLFRTKYSRYWGEQPQVFHADYVGLDTSAALKLIESGVELVGVDGFSVAAEEYMLAVHRLLLEAGLAIVENLDLQAVPAGLYNLYCLPLKIVGTDGAPARVILTDLEP